MSIARNQARRGADLPSHLPRFTITRSAWHATFELIPPDLAEMTGRFGVLMEGGFPYFVRNPRGR